MDRGNSREEKLISDLWSENKDLKAKLAREKKRNGYLTRKIRTLKQGQSDGSKVRNDDSGQKDRKTRNLRPKNWGNGGPGGD